MTVPLLSVTSQACAVSGTLMLVALAPSAVNNTSAALNGRINLINVNPIFTGLLILVVVLV
jgi:hypothetical protein